jgi:hypothetical protein
MEDLKKKKIEVEMYEATQASPVWPKYILEYGKIAETEKLDNWFHIFHFETITRHKGSDDKMYQTSYRFKYEVPNKYDEAVAHQKFFEVLIPQIYNHLLLYRAPSNLVSEHGPLEVESELQYTEAERAEIKLKLY